MEITLYVFDTHRKVRSVIVEGITELLHEENKHAIQTKIPIEVKAKPGDAVGLWCVDGRFRMFDITAAEDDDRKRLTIVNGTDAAITELTGIIVENKQQLDVTARTAVEGLLEGTDWSVGEVAVGEETAKTKAYFQSIWEMLSQFTSAYAGTIYKPYYEFTGGKITGKKIDILKDEGVYRGRLFESGVDASNVRIIRKNSPVTGMYGLGRAQGTGDDADRLTFASVVWSKANGDPADKPEGQTWISDPEAVEKYGSRKTVVVSNDTEDPGELLKITWDELQKAKNPAVTATALVQDMEMTEGYGHLSVRMGDIVVIRPWIGEDIEARITGITRDYVKPWLTKITIGEKTASTASTVASLYRNAQHTKESLTIYKNRIKEDEKLLELNAEAILLSATHIQANADSILMVSERMLIVSEELDVLSKDVNIYAEELNVVVAKAGELESQIKLKADIILLEGYVQADELYTKMLSVMSAGIDNAYIDSLGAGNIYAEGTINGSDLIGEVAQISTLYVGGTQAVWKSRSFVSGVTFGQLILTKTGFSYLDANGNVATRTVVTDAELSTSSANTSAISYLGS